MYLGSTIIHYKSTRSPTTCASSSSCFFFVRPSTDTVCLSHKKYSVSFSFNWLNGRTKSKRRKACEMTHTYKVTRSTPKLAKKDKGGALPEGSVENRVDFVP